MALELVYHSDRGVQYLSIRYTERVWDAGGATSVGGRGDTYDNAVVGLYKTELIRNKGSMARSVDLEIATLEWVDWWNNRRLLEPIGRIPPSEAEAPYSQVVPGQCGWESRNQVSIKPGWFKVPSNSIALLFWFMVLTSEQLVWVVSSRGRDSSRVGQDFLPRTLSHQD